MKFLIFVIISIFVIIQPIFSKELYHILEFTESEPIIIERCIDKSKIQNLQKGYVKETLDSLGRCIKLEFYKKPGVLYTSVDFPGIVEYTWTDSSLIERLYENCGEIFSPEEFVRPNKIEYILNDYVISKTKEFYNEIMVKSNTCIKSTLENTLFFLMYSGCKIKFNQKYQIKF